MVVSTVDIRGRLYEVDLKSGRGRWLTGGTAIDRQPLYSRDGERVIFTSTRFWSGGTRMKLMSGL